MNARPEPAALDDPAVARDRVLRHLAQSPAAASADLVGEASRGVDWYMQVHDATLGVVAQRALMGSVLAALERQRTPGAPRPALPPRPEATLPDPAEAAPRPDRSQPHTFAVIARVMETLDVAVLARQDPARQRDAIGRQVRSVVADLRLELNAVELAALVEDVTNEMLGFGPLEPLLADDRISDILVNGPSEVFVEREGRLQRTPVRFRDDAHVLNIAARIVSGGGRRVDETTPLVDTRLPDGSRVNIIIPPLAIDGPTLTIRKFPASALSLDDMVRLGSMSGDMARYLRMAAQARLNVLVAGGTGAGKTMLLNALSREISHDERIITIEDAAELQLQQPHVVRLESRPPTLEGTGEVTMRHLLRNALRMRPDRIVVGEVRGNEVIDFLQAMTTGHDGSLSTLHANSPREAITRLENLVAMSGVGLPPESLRGQLRDALHVIVQVARMRDGRRRVVAICEIVGIEGGTLTMQEMFRFDPAAEGASGGFRPGGFQSAFRRRAAELGIEAAVAGGGA